MSRLSKHQKKQFYAQLFLYFLLLVLIIVFVATVGLRLLLSTSISVARFFNADNNNGDQQTEKIVYMETPQIYEIPSATNSAKTIISGFASSNNNLRVIVNGQRQKEINPVDDSFETDIELKEGKNTVFLELENPETNTVKKTRTYTVFYKKEKPSLEVTYPEDGFETSQNEIEIRGTTDKEVYIRINNLPVVVNSQGEFSYSIRLSEGENKIVVEAKDIAGNVESKELIVFYQTEE